MGLCPLNLEMVLLLGSIISSYESTQEYICLKTANLKTLSSENIAGYNFKFKTFPRKKITCGHKPQSKVVSMLNMFY